MVLFLQKGLTEKYLSDTTMNNQNGERKIVACYIDGKWGLKDEDGKIIWEPNNLLSIFLDHTNKNVPVGAYVKYQYPDKNLVMVSSDSGTNLDQVIVPKETRWQVFYNNDGQLDIISCDSVADIKLIGKQGYMNAVDVLNKVCSAFVNPDYATSARCLGSDVSSIDKIELHEMDLCYNSHERFPYMDGAFFKDVKQLLDNNCIKCKGSVWLASRVFYLADATSIFWESYYFGVRVLFHNKNVGNSYLYKVEHNGKTEIKYEERGIRPVISLKPDIKIIGGIGTKEEPFIIT